MLVVQTAAHVCAPLRSAAASQVSANPGNRLTSKRPDTMVRVRLSESARRHRTSLAERCLGPAVPDGPALRRAAVPVARPAVPFPGGKHARRGRTLARPHAARPVALAFVLLGMLLPLQARAEYVQELFNGRDMNCWVVTGCRAEVQDGALVLVEGNGLVRSLYTYDDFELDLEWRARKEAAWDSGIYFRASLPPEGRPWPARYQVNLAAGQEGAVRGFEGTARPDLVKAGQWNRFVLRVAGRRASLEINGKPAWEIDRIEEPEGYVGLQAEVPSGGQVEFRNISVRELEHQSLFNGQDLEGWEPADTRAGDCWQVEEGLLTCTGSEGSWLRSRREFGDFDLRLEYRLEPGGNSGVFLRVPENGAHQGREHNHGEPSGVEVQILDDAAEQYRDLAPYQYSASVYAIAAARDRVARPAGEWNSLQITCRGTHYRVIHNGITVVDATADDLPELADRNLRGYLGLQNHGTRVWFRHLRIRSWP